MCTKVQATIAYFFFFLANKTLNTFLKEQMEISCDPFENEKKKAMELHSMIDEELKEENVWVQIKITYVYKDFTIEQLTRCTLRLI